MSISISVSPVRVCDRSFEPVYQLRGFSRLVTRVTTATAGELTWKWIIRNGANTSTRFGRRDIDRDASYPDNSLFNYVNMGMLRVHNDTYC